jgi:hypothetical protein
MAALVGRAKREPTSRLSFRCRAAQAERDGYIQAKRDRNTTQTAVVIIQQERLPGGDQLTRECDFYHRQTLQCALA